MGKMNGKTVDGWTFSTNFFTERMEKDINEWNRCYGTIVGQYSVYQLEKGCARTYVVYNPDGAPIIENDTLEGMSLFMSLYKDDMRSKTDLLTMVGSDNGADESETDDDFSR